MTSDERQRLAKAVCAWLAYKELTGARKILSEAMLTLPISEYLRSGTSWQLKPEYSYRKLKNANNLPDFWCDFAASKKYGNEIRFILEAKYLKVKAENRARQIAADIVRLAMPPGLRGLQRYFLLAGASHLFPDSSADFLFGKRLFASQKGQYVCPFDEISKPSFRKTFPVFQDLVKNSAKSLIPNSIWLQCCASESINIDANRGYKVLIWSVARAKRG